MHISNIKTKNTGKQCADERENCGKFSDTDGYCQALIFVFMITNTQAVFDTERAL